MGSRIRIEKRLTLARNKAMTNMGNGNVLSRRETWSRSSASIAMPKGIWHEIGLNLRRYLVILKLVNFV